jgi:hypothetical protein
MYEIAQLYALNSAMVTLDHSVYKQIVNEIIRWNSIIANNNLRYSLS